MSKTALIVDDSPLARHVLGQLLATHGINAATAPSAEEALEFLKHRRPDVVFMDHLMPGMDGFEALEAIKANPATATIPVMMYTSQEGELYVGQARALGAFGVLPKDLKPTEVMQVLHALKLVPSPLESAATTAGGTTPHPDDSQRVTALLEELFYQQRSALREEIREGYQKAVASMRPPEAGDDVRHALPAKANWPRTALLALGLLSAILGTLYWNASRVLETERQLSARLLEQNSALSSLASTATETIDARPVVPPQNSLSALEWAVNLSGQYAFRETPLNEQRAQQLNRLVQFLDETGFAGVIAVEVHVGRFCMNYGDDGAWALAPEAMLAESCDQLAASTAETDVVSNRQSLGFANLLAAADRGGGPQIRMSFQGDSRPILPYPDLNSFVTAGEWNAVAAINQRVEIRLLQ